MVWFKVDDTLPFHEKIVAAGNAAVGLWTRAGAWSAQQLTDGFVPDHIVAAMGSKSQANRLVSVRLWHRAERDGLRGFQFHQWNEDGRQPTRAAVEKERSEARDRMRKAREAKRAQAGDSGEVRANTGRSSGDVRSTRPDPTRPDPSRTTSAGGVAVPDAGATPPTFTGRCPDHVHDPAPPNCGRCADARKAASRRLTIVSEHTPCLVHLEPDAANCRGCAADRKAAS